MYQWKDKGDRSGQNHPEAALDTLQLLESPDLEAVESVQNVIQENLCATKDPRLLNGLVDYYLAVKSKRSLDILLRMKDPHDKHLFEKISELMKNENYRYESLQLLSNLIYRQPTWLHKIASHRIMNTLLHMLKTDVNAPNLMSGLFILICLLPLIPSKFGPFLSDTFEVFSRLASWSVKKPSSMLDIYVMHLRIGIYSLFHRLYGMFPCNFLAYLRSFYGGRDFNEDNFKVFNIVIKPMLERVRLHHLLVTASKETELHPNRWKKMDYHDIIVDCATISLDAIEGTLEASKKKTSTITSIDQNISNHDSGQFVSFSSQSSTSLTMESESLVTDAMSSNPHAMWSPSHIVALKTPPPLGNATQSPLPVKEFSPMSCVGEWDVKNYSVQLPVDENVPLDFAVEAKPEVLKVELGCPNAQIVMSSKGQGTTTLVKNLNTGDSVTAGSGLGHTEKSTSQETEMNIEHLKTNENILSAVEVREDDADKEVSELTSNQHSATKSCASEDRNYTPFCSTTQNLTAEPANLPPAMSTSERSDSLTKSQYDDIDEMYNSLHETDLEAFVPSFSRYRYFSHCGSPPDIPIESIKKPKTFRSNSCPAKLCPSSENQATSILTAQQDIAVPQPLQLNPTTSAFVPVRTTSVVSNQERLVTYHDLIPIAMNSASSVPCPMSGSFGSPYYAQNAYLNSLSPPELLDHYIQSGSDTYLSQLDIPMTSSKSTDWTHFGGKPPPDEIAILRNQIKLLHCQLMFERHRKDVHSERNRSILGRSKRSRMQEDHIAALKEQISLLQQDNQSLKSELAYQSKLYHQLRFDKQEMETDLNSKFLKTESENIQLLYSNKKLQNLLVSQKEENDEIREGCKRSHSEMENLKFQLELANKEMQRYQKLEKDASFLSKQVMLLQELNRHYKDKIEQIKEPPLPDFGEELMNTAAVIEIKDLKLKLDSKTHILEVSKAKITELDQLISNMKSKLKDQMQAFEDVKSFHKNEIMVREDWLSDLRKVSIQKDAHILDLNKNMETLSEKIRKLESHIDGASNSKAFSDNYSTKTSEGASSNPINSTE